jgi:hypothetical protein
MKRKILLLFLSIVGFAPLFASSPAEYKEGDIVFIMPKSSQAPLIRYVTSSMWTHCGIVVYKGGEQKSLFIAPCDLL